MAIGVRTHELGRDFGAANRCDSNAQRMLQQGDVETRVATRPVEHPVDICGAGDSFSAGAVLALCAGASPQEAAVFGNLVASITIMKAGTGTASPAEVLNVARERGL